MVNVNTHRDPAVYALHAGDHQYFYVGSTSVNSQNRLYQHISRARAGHPAAVYQKMREIGIGLVVVEDLAKEADPETRAGLEVAAIASLLRYGMPLTNKIWAKGAGLPTASNEYRTIVRQAYRLAHPLERKPRKPRAKKISCPWPRKERKPKAPRLPNHGTRTEWEKYKCKCDPCRLVGAQRNASRRGQSIPTDPPTRGRSPEHGTANRYKHFGCRCDDCRVALRISRQKAK